MINLFEHKDKEIKEFIEVAITNKDVEMEYIFGINERSAKEILTKDLFSRLLKYSSKNYAEIDKSYNLDIKTVFNNKKGKDEQSTIRCTLKDLESIKEYCKKDELTGNMDLEFLEKKSYRKNDKFYSLRENEYNYRLNLKTEKDLDSTSAEVQDFKNNWKNERKYFRYKYRYSFITKDGLFRIDLTAVKSNNYNKIKQDYDYFNTFKKNRILDAQEVYELEIEYIGNMKCNNILNIQNFIENGEQLVNVLDDNTYTSVDLINIGTTNILTKLSIEENLPDIDQKSMNKVMERFNEVIYDINTFIYDTEYIMKKTEIDLVLNEYYEYSGQENSKYKRLLIPQPVTLNFDGLDIKNNGNIFNNYLVTEKADGLRFVLFVAENKKGYLINSRMVVKDTGIIFTTVNDKWVLDGEYITQDKYGKKINLYMIFDVYYAGGETEKPAHAYKFISNITSRNDILDIFKMHVEKSKNRGNMRISFKNYQRGHIKSTNIDKQKSILIKSKEILDRAANGGYEYKIDGLIYLPANLSVNGEYGKKPSNKINGPWCYNYKWKPPEENTIDFLVNIKNIMHNKKSVHEIFPYVETDSDGKMTTHRYKKLIVKVLYKDIDLPCSEINYCMKILDNKSKGKNKEERIRFDPPNATSDLSETNILLENGKILCEDMDEIKDGDIVEMRYNPHAKNNMIWEPLKIRRDKTTPQFFTVANNVWQTIVDPITTDMIRGDIQEIQDKLNIHNFDSNYYVTGKISKELDPLKKFHNYIKSKLIIGVGSSSNLKTKKRIMDTSIGQGGDIKKYTNRDVNCEFLFGLDYAPVDEACKRFYLDKSKTKIKSVMLRYDTSKNIKNKSGILDNNSHAENMINILYDIKDTELNKEYKNINKVYKGLANHKFDIISSQFTIHYYFKDEETLTGYLTNLLENIHDGGFFIGTCYDGKLIFDELNKAEPFEYKTKKDKIYSIEKKYNIKNFDFNGTKENMLGQEIDVYMNSIGQTITEYLVNFDYFIDIMSQYGFEPYLPEIKNKYSNVIDSSIGSFVTILKKLDEFKKDDVELRTYYSDSLNILKDEKLLRLSSMNKYFIFIKK